MKKSFDTILVSPQPYKFATRARKAAALLAQQMSVSYVAMSKAGRTARWDQSGEWSLDNVDVCQVGVGRIRLEPSRGNVLKNLSLTYAPALLRMASEILGREALTVFANGPAMLPLALLHKWKFSSLVILDVPERPGMVNVVGSAASLFSKFEERLLKLSRPFVTQAFAVTNADVKYLESLGFRKVQLVRNVPLIEWKAPYSTPPIFADKEGSVPLSLLAMGSVFEGRGYEKLIEAVSIASGQVDLQLTICGPSIPAYLDGLKRLSDETGVSDRIRFVDPVPTHEVSGMYMSADIGMVLYESLDPGNDGLSNKLFECVSSGRPVIASDLPENRRFVQENEVGWLAGDSAEQIARAIIAAADPSEIELKAGHCRALGDEFLNWETEFPVAPFASAGPHGRGSLSRTH